MDAKELRKLSRKDLLELLLAQTELNENLKAEIVFLKQKQSEHISESDFSPLEEKIKKIDLILDKCETVSKGYITAINQLKSLAETSVNQKPVLAEVDTATADITTCLPTDEALCEDEHLCNEKQETPKNYTLSSDNSIDSYLDNYFDKIISKGRK